MLEDLSVQEILNNIKVFYLGFWHDTETNSYNKNEFNSKGYMFVVAGEDGRCESGIGRIKENALNECTKWQIENNIVGTCELYGEADKVVWDGSVWDD